MRGQHVPLRRSDYQAILDVLQDGPKGAFDIRMDAGITRSEWHTRRRDILKLGLMVQEGRKYAKV
jgi:hypothetical protein